MNNRNGKNCLRTLLTFTFFILSCSILPIVHAQAEKKVENKLALSVLQTKLSICRLDAKAPIPDWVSTVQSDFISITRTSEELSIVCDKKHVPAGVQSVSDWYAIKVEGPLDFGLIGILSSLLDPLAKAGISVFTVSTYDTDYILVKEQNIKKAIAVLKNKYTVKEPKFRSFSGE